MCSPKIHKDNRGYFTEFYRQDKLEKFLGHKINFCQSNQSKSSYGVIRGLHYQMTPYAQTKLIRVVSGRILDVVIDLRKDSPTFGNHLKVELSADEKKLLLIPKGFAHGFIVLSQEATISYKLDNYFNSDYERGISFYDPELGIDWPIRNNEIKVSKKDAKLPLFKNAEIFDSSIDFYV